MSTWHKSGRDALDIDGDEINIWVTSDDSGSIYTTVKIEDILDLLKDRFKSV